MNSNFLVFLFFILFLIGVYLIITEVLNSGSGNKIEKYIKSSLTSNRSKSTLTMSLIRAVAKYIKVETYKRNKLDGDLKKIRSSYTVEEYIARGYVNAIIPLLLIPFVVLLVKGLLAIVLIVAVVALSIIKYLSNKQLIEDQLKIVKEKIIEELPRFVGNFKYSFQGNKDYVDVIKKYRKVCKPAFEYDLDVLLVDLKTIDQEEAFRRFDERLGINELSTFISVLIGLTSGTDPNTAFTIVENDMQVLMKKNLDEIKNKTPGKLRTWVILCSIVTIVLAVSPMINMAIKNFIIAIYN